MRAKGFRLTDVTMMVNTMLITMLMAMAMRMTFWTGVCVACGRIVRVATGEVRF